MTPTGKPHHASLSSPQFPPGTAKVLREGNSCCCGLSVSIIILKEYSSLIPSLSSQRQTLRKGKGAMRIDYNIQIGENQSFD